MMVPLRYFVVKCKDQWRVEFESTYKNGFQIKKSAIQHAIEAAQEMAHAGKRCEVLVQDEDKRWYTAWYSEEDFPVIEERRHIKKG